MAAAGKTSKCSSPSLEKKKEKFSSCFFKQTEVQHKFGLFDLTARHGVGCEE